MTEEHKKAKILIVEDESVNAKLLESRVRKFGHIPIGPAQTGEAAIELAQAEKPDLVLMDIRLQGEMDGIEAAKIIKEEIHTQIIYVTAHSEEEFLERAKPTIPHGYILKPFQEKELRITIEMALYVGKVDVERRRSESTLKEREELLNATGMMAKVGGWELDAKTLEVNWTEQTHRIHEVPLDYQPPLEEAINFFHPDDRKKLSDVITLALEQGEPYDMEVRFITAKGNKLWTRTKCIPEIVNGKVVKLKGTFQDITELKEIEQDLRRSERKYRLLADNANDVIYTLDMNLNYTYVSPSVFKMRGFLPEEILSGSISQSLTDNSMTRAAQLIEKELEIESREDSDPNRVSIIELEMNCKDGTTIWTEAKVSFLRDDDGNPIGIIGASRDISDRKKTEEKLKESEKRYRQLFNNAPAGIYDIDFVQNKITSVNDIACHISGYSRDEILNMSPLDLLSDNSKTLFFSRLESIELENRNSDTVEFEILKKSGEKIWVLLSINFNYDNNQIVGASVVAHDITDKVRAENALEESEAKHRQMVANISDVIAILDENAVIKYKSPNITKCFGWQPEDLVETDGWKTVHPDDLDRVKREFYGLVNDEVSSKTIEYRYKCKDGSYKLIQLTATNLLNDPSINGILANYHDITEKRNVEQSLRETEERFRLAFNTSPDAININRLDDGLYIDVNDGFTQLTGFTREDSIGKTSIDIDIWHEPTDRKKLVEGLRKNGYYDNLEAQFRKKDGSITTALMSARVIDLNGIPHIISITRDISDRKNAEKALLESEKKYRTLFDQSVEGIYLHEVDGRIVDVNEMACKQSGYTRKELLKLTVFDFHPEPPESRNLPKDEILQQWSQWKHGDRLTIEAEHRRKDGSVYPVNISTGVIRYGGRNLMLAIVQDITDRKQAEEKLRYIERRNQALLDYSPVCHKIVDLDFNLQYMSANGFKMLKLEPDADVYGKPYPFYFFSESFKDEMKSNMEIVKESGSPVNMEAQTNDIEGNKVWLDSALIPVFDDAGNIEYLTIVSADTTSRKNADETLRESEKQFRHFFEHLTIGVAVYEAVEDGNDFVFSDMNPIGQKLSQVSINAIRGKRLTEVFPGVQDLGLFKALQNTWRTGQPSHVPFGKYADERITQWVENRVFRLPSGRIVAVYDDRTEVKRLEEELRQAQKMEAIGTLAGGIAHDFNNLLQAINGYTQLLMMEKTGDEPEYKSLNEIYKSSNRASDLVRQLLLFSRKGDAVRKAVELNHEVEDARKMLERTIPKMVNIEIHPGGRLWSVMADPVQIEQILLNLGTNAADAMPDGGKLIFETENITIDDEYCQNHLGAQPGKYVLLSITDTGEGIDDVTKEKIFEPFFTTKEFGKGTGLGLASVYGIVKAHGGYIMCYSEVGMGTTFKIYLPAMEDPKAEPDREVSDERPKGGSETILLVDDESSIRDFASQVLLKFGYTPLAAISGEEALEIYSTRWDEIDMVVIDLGMPGMGGHKCVQELLKINPDIKVIIASGYSVNGQVKDTLEAGAKGFVGKPYQIHELLGKVRDVLDEED